MIGLSQWPKWWLVGVALVIIGYVLNSSLIVWIGLVSCIGVAIIQVVRVVALIKNRK